MLKILMFKAAIHEATFFAGDTATLILFVRAAHEISNATFYKLLENKQPVYFQATSRMYHAIFPCAARTNNNAAVSPVTKVASCMVGLNACYTASDFGRKESDFQHCRRLVEVTRCFRVPYTFSYCCRTSVQ